MTGGKLALTHVTLKLVVEGEETDAVCDAGARLAETFRDGFLGEAKVTHQRGEAEGFVDGVKIGPLQILDEREHGTGSVTGVEDARGDGLLADQLEGAETAFAGDEFVAVLHLPNDDRLHQAFGANGVRKFLHLGVVEITARLARIRDD